MSSSKPASELTPIVTFYSYKGGVGRSMAVLNVATLLASRGFRVLIIDFDLEAPGLSHLVLPRSKKKAAAKSNRTGKGGLVELLSDAKERGLKSHLFASKFSAIATRYTFSYKIPKVLDSHPDARLSIMPAGVQDDDYSARLHRLNLAGLYEEGLGKPLIEHFRQRLIDSGLYEYILIDSRTGHSDEAGICTRDLADHRMVVSGLNTQNVEGTAAFLRNLRAALRREKKPIKDPDIILSPVPNSEDDLIARRERAARDAFNSAWGKPLPPLNLLIPYHPRLALSEEAYVPTITASPLRNAYLDIEARFRRSFGHSPNEQQTLFLSHLDRGNGSAALATLRRWIKLSRNPGKPGTAKVAISPSMLPDDYLSKFLNLPEALDILELWFPNADNSLGLRHVAQRLYKIHAPVATKFNNLLLNGNFLDADELGSHALFLQTTRKDTETAEAFYKRSIEIDPKHANNLGNYGQLLLGQGRVAEGLKQLRSAWEHIEKTIFMHVAEVAFSLWLGTRFAGAAEPAWERSYKFLIRKGFARAPWDFDAMLAEAKKVLESTEVEYAKTLAEAFLDESKVPALDQFSRWTILEPLDPELVRPDGSICSS